MNRTQSILLILVLLCFCLPAAVGAQGAPFGPAGPPVQQYVPYEVPPPQYRQPQQQPQQGSQYAFRPNLTNPEYGECLALEKNYRMLWDRYAMTYEQARSLHPSDPRYSQMANYLMSLRPQLDEAWQAFSGKCIYFPERR